MVEQVIFDDLSPEDASRLVSLAVGFLVATTQPKWGNFVAYETLTEARSEFIESKALIEKDLKSLKAEEMPAAIMKLIRGFSILCENPGDSSGVDDLYDALNTVEVACAEPKASPEDKILCFGVICACFLVLREASTALTSICAQLDHLFGDEGIKKSLKSLRSCLQNKRKMAMFREDKARLDLLFSRLCAVYSACERLKGFSESGARQRFQKLLSEHLCGSDGKQDSMPVELSESNWQSLIIFKMAAEGTIATASIPAAAMILIDPLTAPLALGSLPLAMKLPFLTKALSHFDELPNFFDLRAQVRNICLGKDLSSPSPVEDGEEEIVFEEQQEVQE